MIKDARVVYARGCLGTTRMVEKEEQKRDAKRDAKREELNLVERPNVEERAATEQNAVEEKDSLKKGTIII
jgi:hypothetical protein